MVADFLADLADLSLGHNGAAAHEYHAVGDAIDFLQDMAGNDDVHPLLGNRFKERDRFRAGHGIKAVERFVENQHGGMMSDGLREANALTHPFAIAGYLAPRHLGHASALQRFVRELGSLIVRKTMKPAGPTNELIAHRAGSEGVKLCAVSHVPKELYGLLRGKAEDENRTL